MVQDKASELVDEFLAFWSANVDPSALSLPYTFLDHLCRAKSMAGKPQTRLAITIAMYTEEGAQLKTPPSPNVCGLVTTGDLAALDKTPFVAEMVEKTLDKLHFEWEPMIAEHKGRDGQVPAHDVKRMVTALQKLLARAALGKKLDPVLGACAVVPGKLTAQKLNELLGFWSKAVDEEFPNLEFAKATGLVKFQTLAPTPAGDTFTVTTMPLPPLA